MTTVSFWLESENDFVTLSGFILSNGELLFSWNGEKSEGVITYEELLRLVLVPF